MLYERFRRAITRSGDFRSTLTRAERSVNARRSVRPTCKDRTDRYETIPPRKRFVRSIEAKLINAHLHRTEKLASAFEGNIKAKNHNHSILINSFTEASANCGSLI